MQRSMFYGAVTWAFVGLLCSLANAQDGVLDELYGRGVHSYFAGNSSEAYQHLNSAIEQGSQDPRVYYFRGLSLQNLGRPDEAQADFETGALLEARQGLTGTVSRALERVQGSRRLEIENHRRDARLAVRMQQREGQQARFEQTQRAEERVLRDPNRRTLEVPDLPEAREPSPTDPFDDRGIVAGEAEVAPPPPEPTPEPTDPFEEAEPAPDAAPPVDDADPFGAPVDDADPFGAPLDDADPFGAPVDDALPADADDPFADDRAVEVRPDDVVDAPPGALEGLREQVPADADELFADPFADDPAAPFDAPAPADPLDAPAPADDLDAEMQDDLFDDPFADDPLPADPVPPADQDAELDDDSDLFDDPFADDPLPADPAPPADQDAELDDDSDLFDDPFADDEFDPTAPAIDEDTDEDDPFEGF